MNPQQPLNEYRTRIDALDVRVIELLAERTDIVRQLMVFKTDENSVRSCDRVKQVLDRVRGLATEHGMPPIIAERTYRALIDALTDMQLEFLSRQHAGDAT